MCKITYTATYMIQLGIYFTSHKGDKILQENKQKNV